MRCNTCNSQGHIEKLEVNGFYRIYPCPDCHGGYQHCCDGEDWCPPTDKTRFSGVENY